MNNINRVLTDYKGQLFIVDGREVYFRQEVVITLWCPMRFDFYPIDKQVNLVSSVFGCDSSPRSPNFTHPVFLSRFLQLPVPHGGHGLRGQLNFYLTYSTYFLNFIKVAAPGSLRLVNMFALSSNVNLNLEAISMVHQNYTFHCINLSRLKKTDKMFF